MTTTQITFLGTGTSHGVPMIGCKCPVCNSTDSRNHRTRTSAMISYNGKSILIDTTPELRLQCIANDISRVDAVLFTHAHADHIFGLDDIRRFNEMQGTKISCFGSQDTLAVIRQAFDYIFVPTQEGGGKPKLDLVPVSEQFEAVGVPVIPIPVMHGEVNVFGYRICDFAYITDCNYIPKSSMELLHGLDVLVLGALRHQPHSTHFTLAEAVKIALDVKAKETYFVHMSHGLEHEKTNQELPPNIQLAYDGLIVNL